MGKHLPKREPPLPLSLEKNNPGCMLSLVDVLHHQRWRHVRKMLPHRRHDRRTDTAPAAATTNHDFKQQNPAPKSSVKKLKSLFLIEMSKNKGKHRRTSSCPDKSQLKRTESIHLLEPPITEYAASPQVVNNGNNKHRCPVLHDGLKPQDDSTATQSKQLLDALDIFNMNKELFRKLLRDPVSPLTYHIHKQQTSKLQAGYAKSLSFPSRFGQKTELSSSDKHEAKEDLETYATMRNLKPQSGQLDEKGNQNISPKAKTTSDDSPDHNYCPCSPSGRKGLKGNVKVMNHFKNLRRKIKHAIRESKKERQRVTMDAVLHKIPYGKKCPKDVTDKVSEIWKDPNLEKSDKPGRGATSFRSMSMAPSGRRATSFDPPIDKYNWLFESSCRKEISSAQVVKEIEKNEKMDKEKPSSSSGNIKKSLERIVSLPDLRSYHYLLNELSPDAATSLVRPTGGNVLKDDPNKAVVKLEERSKDVQEHSENVTAEHDKESQSFKNEELEDDLGLYTFRLLRNETESTPVLLLDPPQEDIANPPSAAAMYLPEVELVKEHLQLDPESFFYFEKEDLGESNKQEETIQHSPVLIEDKLPSIQINNNDIVEFNYVKTVLERSGLSVKDRLSSVDQPVGRLVYEEMEDGLVLDSSFPEPKIDNWDRLLLFDLINEVLMDIHDRAFTYCPLNLTWVSQIRPIPTKGRVLEEVWIGVYWYLSWKPQAEDWLDGAVTRDMEKYDGWMNIQLDAECVGLELEDMIFDDLLDELQFDLEWN